MTYSKEDAFGTDGPGRVAVLRAGNIQDAEILLEDLVYVPRSCVSKAQLLLRGDILIATSSGSLDVVGKAAAVTNNVDAAFGAFCKVLRPRKGVNHRYFAYYFRTDDYRRIVSGLAGGANINNLRNEHLDELLVPVPRPEDQARIADRLDGADAIRRRRKAASALVTELIRSTFLEMFGDPVTNPRGWVRRPLCEVGDVTTGNTPSRAVPEYFGDAVEWIKSDNINTPSHYLTVATEGLSVAGKAVGRIVPSGSSLVTCIAGSPECIGNVALTDREVAFNQQINAVSPKLGVDSGFLYTLLLVGKRLVQAASTSGMKGMVSKGRLEAVMVPFPPSDLRQEFGRRLECLLALSRRQEVAIEESERLFRAELHRAFNIDRPESA